MNEPRTTGSPADSIRSVASPAGVRDAVDHYHRTGSFRPGDYVKVFGSNSEGVTVRMSNPSDPRNLRFR